MKEDKSINGAFNSQDNRDSKHEPYNVLILISTIIFCTKLWAAASLCRFMGL